MAPTNTEISKRLINYLLYEYNELVTTDHGFDDETHDDMIHI